MTSILLLLTSFFSAFIQSTTGFGYAIMFMAITPYFLDYNVASVLSLATSPVGNVANVVKRFKRVNWKQVIIPMLFATASTYIAIELTKNVELSTMRRVLGCLLFFLAECTDYLGTRQAFPCGTKNFIQSKTDIFIVGNTVKHYAENHQ